MKIFVWKQSRTVWFSCFAAVCMLVYILTYSTLAGAYATDRPLPIYCVDQSQKICSISFDAAWGNAPVRRFPPRFPDFL